MPMDYALICLVSLLVAGLTFFSGFGLGTLLMPVFALFFPLDVAIAATAVIHLANNLFKVGLVGRHANMRITRLFALPAAIAALGGAWLLSYLTALPTLYTYSLAGRHFAITPVKLIIAGVITVFALLELHPALARLRVSTKLVPLGGILSGFFGGLSGHQGALRSAFLMRTHLDKQALIATAVLSAVLVDISRLLVYGSTLMDQKIDVLKLQDGIGLVIAGSLAAFTGSVVGSRLLRTVTLYGLKTFMALMLILLAIALGSGLI